MQSQQLRNFVLAQTDDDDDGVGDLWRFTRKRTISFSWDVYFIYFTGDATCTVFENLITIPALFS